jgi:hypothetical protein
MMRRENDFYPTPARLTEHLLKHVPISGRVLEPCAGDGAIVNILAAEPNTTHVATNDIDEQYDWYYCQDATDPSASIWNYGDWYGLDWVVTNPPFNAAFPILENAFNVARAGVAFLLRLSFLEPTNGRGPWLEAHQDCLSDLLIFGSPRPSFTGTGTDSVTVAWMVWRKEKVEGARIKFITNWKSAADVERVTAERAKEEAAG